MPKNEMRTLPNFKHWNSLLKIPIVKKNQLLNTTYILVKIFYYIYNTDYTNNNNWASSFYKLWNVRTFSIKYEYIFTTCAMNNFYFILRNCN